MEIKINFQYASESLQGNFIWGHCRTETFTSSEICAFSVDFCGQAPPEPGIQRPDETGFPLSHSSPESTPHPEHRITTGRVPMHTLSVSQTLHTWIHWTVKESNVAVPMYFSHPNTSIFPSAHFSDCPSILSPVKLQAWWVAFTLISHKWLSLHLCIVSQACCLHPCSHDHCSIRFSLAPGWWLVHLAGLCFSLPSSWMSTMESLKQRSSSSISVCLQRLPVLDR